MEWQKSGRRHRSWTGGRPDYNRSGNHAGSAAHGRRHYACQPDRRGCSCKSRGIVWKKGWSRTGRGCRLHSPQGDFRCCSLAVFEVHGGMDCKPRPAPPGAVSANFGAVVHSDAGKAIPKKLFENAIDAQASALLLTDELKRMDEAIADRLANANPTL